MSKVRSEYICQNCGAKSPSWLGKCPQCGKFSTLVETPILEDQGRLTKKEGLRPLNLASVKAVDSKRISTGSDEFDRVLGGGIVPGSVNLIAGDPGIGKSTLLLQLALKAISTCLYISGEESLHQIKLRAERVIKKGAKENLLLLSETDIEKIVATIESEKPKLLIVDSIQTVFWEKLSGTPGSVGQVRECARIIHEVAKRENISTLLVGHVTKEGMVAGPRVLEHLVDVVLYLEGEKYHNFRILRSHKNRFGTILEIGVFEMAERGLLDVANPSALFLSQRREGVSGSVILPAIYGRRPILAEVQALVAPTAYPLPKRTSQGVDFRRLELILAVLANRVRIPVSRFDIFVNIAGGLKIEEPAADLAIALAIFSAIKGKSLSNSACVFGEVGLLGEVRVVSEQERRIAEAKKFGLKHVLSPPRVKTLEGAINFVTDAP